MENMEKIFERIIEIGSSMNDGIFAVTPKISIAKKKDLIGVRINLSDSIPTEENREVFVFDIKTSGEIKNKKVVKGNREKKVSKTEAIKYLSMFIEEYNKMSSNGDELINIKGAFDKKDEYKLAKGAINFVCKQMEGVKNYLVERKHMSKDEIIEFSIDTINKSDIKKRYFDFEDGLLEINDDIADYYKDFETPIESQILDCTFLCLMAINKINGKIKREEGAFDNVIRSIIKMFYNFDQKDIHSSNILQ